jgi:Lrp/AsnC family transcriptional regulator for asnA, asnC and gidA
MKIDQTAIAIIKHLREGRKSFHQIAQNLNLAENTVRSRVRQLSRAGVLEIAGLVDPESIPNHQSVIIGVKLKTTDMFNKGREFSKLKGVVSVSVVTGRYDLILVVLFKEGYGLEEFYTREVTRIEDVQSLETFVVCKGYNLKVPYIL